MFNECERAQFELGNDTRVHTPTLRDLNAIYCAWRVLLAASSPHRRRRHIVVGRQKCSVILIAVWAHGTAVNGHKLYKRFICF